METSIEHIKYDLKQDEILEVIDFIGYLKIKNERVCLKGYKSLRR